MHLPACEASSWVLARGQCTARAQVCGIPSVRLSQRHPAHARGHHTACLGSHNRWDTQALNPWNGFQRCRPRHALRCGVYASAVSSKRVEERPGVAQGDNRNHTTTPQRPDVEDGMHRLLWERHTSVVFPEEDEERWAPPPEPQPEPGPSHPPGHAGCPVYVMLPLDTVWVVEREGRQVAILKRERALEIALHTLRSAGVEGVMVDVWWGICERAGPRSYDFSAYRRLFHKCAVAGLRVQAVMSFHAAGGNVGDTCKIPLPKWVVDIGERNPDIFYTDKQMHRNKECLSLGCDEVPLFWGRTPVQMYRDFIDAFADQFDYLFGSVITEVTVGLGPAGELRYPSYPEGDGRWRFPGVGEYQCYDKYMLQALWQAACAAGHPEWGHGGPHDAGQYNSRSWETGFFVSQGGNWQSAYGHFFLSWYSGLLVAHADRVLGAAAQVLNKPGRPRLIKQQQQLADGHVMVMFEPAVKLGAKLAGVHWWFKSRAHAAELTAGYYNTRDRDGYAPIIQLIARYNARLSFTCVEMRDCEHPPEGRCSPQGLLQQVLECAERYGVPLAGENALQRYDEHAFDRIAESAFGRTARSGRLEQLTFLRMGDLMFDNWDAFCAFLQRMRATPNQLADGSPPAAGWEGAPSSSSSSRSSSSSSSRGPGTGSACSSSTGGCAAAAAEDAAAGSSVAAGSSSSSSSSSSGGGTWSAAAAGGEGSSSGSSLLGPLPSAQLTAAVASSAAAQSTATVAPPPPLHNPSSSAPPQEAGTPPTASTSGAGSEQQQQPHTLQEPVQPQAEGGAGNSSSSSSSSSSGGSQQGPGSSSSSSSGAATAVGLPAD